MKGGISLHKQNQKEQRITLEKSLRPANIWAIALGSIIGWGAFIQSPNWMVKAGGPLPHEARPERWGERGSDRQKILH